MLRKHLVVARVGRQSLHPTWQSSSSSRSWDLYLCPYQELGEHSGDFTVGKLMPGPKWTGVRELFATWQGWRNYDYIWFPDDDIFASQGTIDEMFRIAQALALDLCAPALHEASYYGHYSTMRNRRCFARRTGFVEIMMPCFSRRGLEKLLPTLDLSTTGWAWGLDALWPKLLEYRNVGIIDATPVLHTRPWGILRDPELDRRVRAESLQIMTEHDCAEVHTTFAAVDSALKTLDLKPDELTVLLAQGWDYLLDSNPAVLPWLVLAQQPRQGWPAYPVAGSPAGGVEVPSRH
jgi:hypothetical protein